MATFAVVDFVQGIDARFEPSKILDGGFALLINGRVRNNVVEPIKSPLLIDKGQPAGNHQGIYAAQQYALLFIGGKAYLKDFRNDSNYQEVEGFQMLSGVEYIYVALVPASAVNFVRSSEDGDASSTVNLTDRIGASPQAVVCQDGISPAMLILSNGSSRAAGTYNNWESPNNREYVPIGKQMAYDGNRLYIIKGNKILRSVTGRPLDFMVVIDQEGNKLPNENAGGAEAVSHSVGYDDLVAISPIPTPSGEMFVSSGKGSWFITPDRSVQLFAEPTFTTLPVFETGPVNQFASAEALGDTIFVDLLGVRSFNAIIQVRNEGRNSQFSLRLQRILGDRKQASAVIGKTGNYLLIAVDTIYGYAVIVWDETTEQFVSVDMYSGVGRIKQFAEYQVGGVKKLLFITADNKHYEFGAGVSYETTSIYVGDWVAGLNKTHKLTKIHCVFTDVRTSGIVYATQFVDGKKDVRVSQFIKQTTIQDAYPEEIPFIAPTQRKLFTATFSLTDSKLRGFKVGAFIEWAFNAKLAFIYTETDEQTENVNSTERAQRFAANVAGIPSIVGILPTSAEATTVITVTGKGFGVVDTVYLGSVVCNVVSQTNTEIRFTVPIGAVSGFITLSYPNGSLTPATEITVE